MDISNKALAIFLLAAVIVSMGGTILSLNQLNRVKQLTYEQPTLPTAFASTASGNVSLTIAGQLSITTVDSNAINFGSCSPISGAYSIINSENLTNTSIVCPSFAQNNISVRNDGNINANVTVRPSNVGNAQGGTFLNATSAGSAIAYKTIIGARGIYGNGCVGNLVAAYTNFSSAINNVTACSNLTFGATNNSFLTNVQIVLPNDVPAGQNDVILTFVAHVGP